MKTITKKGEVSELLDRFIAVYQSQDLKASVKFINKDILSCKIRFPLLEYCGHTLFETLTKTDQYPFCQQIQALQTIGGNVLTGIVLQRNLRDDFNKAIEQTVLHSSQANIWYISDIIGERVFGYSLLHYTQKTIPILQQLCNTENQWVIRSVGAGVHHAVKKGLDAGNCSILFSLLLTQANSREKETRQGIGWAAKTTAKFHPQIIENFKEEIADKEYVANWFRRKVKIGLERNRYAKGNHHQISAQ